MKSCCTLSFAMLDPRFLVVKVIIDIATTMSTVISLLTNSHPQLLLPLLEFGRGVTDHPWILFTVVFWRELVRVPWRGNPRRGYLGWVKWVVRWMEWVVGGRNRFVSDGRVR
jgi:hypothetical protein